MSLLPENGRSLPGDSFRTRMQGRGRFANWRRWRITDVVHISKVNGTGDEGQVLPQWSDEQHLQSMVVVAAKDHSRRLRRVLDRVMKGRGTHATVQAAHYSEFDPDEWWKTRGGVRTEIVEFQKLLLDLALHPGSF